MSITGASIIAGEAVHGTGGVTFGINPATGEMLQPPFHFAVQAEVDRATRLAADTFDEYRATTPLARARFLEQIAANLVDMRQEIVDRAHLETGLPVGRLNGEHARTVGQLRAFARELHLGAHQDVRIDHAQPDRLPAPRPDIRQRRIPLGPVLVFGASNFPLAFSTAGGDTASALAAGCPVIVKAHNSHPGTAELAGQAIASAVRGCALPAGVFSLLYGSGTQIGQALAADPHIKAIGFTGSRAGGMALMRTAAARPEPIPVYAEMSSINPVVLLPGALEQGLEAVAEGFVNSLTLGSGQFCTNPGMVFVPEEWEDRVAAAIDAHVSTRVGATMLSETIASSYEEGVSRLQANGTRQVSTGMAGPTANAPAPTVFAAPASDLADTPELQTEVFGSAAVLVSYSSESELIAALEQVEGQLTMSVHAAAADDQVVQALLPTLERKAGRVVYNAWPTGVEVVDAMTHGGPFPATSDSRTTSVGTLAIERFQRPVTYQGFPNRLLPAPVAEDNEWRLPRRIDGQLGS